MSLAGTEYRLGISPGQLPALLELYINFLLEFYWPNSEM